MKEVTAKWDGTPFTAAEQAMVDQCQATIADLEPKIDPLEQERAVIKRRQEKALREGREELLETKSRLDPILLELQQARTTLDAIWNNNPDRADADLPIR